MTSIDTAALRARFSPPLDADLSLEDAADVLALADALDAARADCEDAVACARLAIDERERLRAENARLTETLERRTQELADADKDAREAWEEVKAARMGKEGWYRTCVANRNAVKAMRPVVEAARAAVRSREVDKPETDEDLTFGRLYAAVATYQAGEKP
jgi:DNA repair exonuclease SbcCD ATPase subunit